MDSQRLPDRLQQLAGVTVGLLISALNWRTGRPYPLFSGRLRLLLLMNTPTRRLQYFFFGQNFSDGVRTTLAILLPALTLAQFGHLAEGITVSTGAVCLSVTDLPGPARHRRNGMLTALAVVFSCCLLTGAVAAHPWLLGLTIGALAFALTMPLVWGARAGAVGTAGLLGVVLLLARPPAPAEVLPHAGLLLLGGLWYAGLALLVHRVRPYRPAQQALGQCVHALAGFVEVKARFYEPGTDLAAAYRQLLAAQVTVNEKQEAARDLLFRTRQIVSETTTTGRRLVLTFVEAVDLYERLTASYYDYDALQASFGGSGVPAAVAALLRQLATELDQLGLAIQANRPYPPSAAATGADPGAGSGFDDALGQLQARISALDDEAGPARDGRTLGLKKILVNLRDISRRVGNIRRYFNESQAAEPTPGRPADHTRFVAPQQIELPALAQSFTLRSGVFRHAVRMALACLVAFLVAEILWRGQHSYWVLLTVAIMLKPGFSLTRERNIQRVIGTLAGGALGAAVLWLLPGTHARFGVLVLFMVLSYSFIRTHYQVMVVFLTAYLLILFSFMGLDYRGVVQERIVDTLLGCAIAFAAGYLLFPNWESEQLTDLMAAALRANLAYLRQLARRLAGQALPPTEYRLLRKDVFVSGANLAAAFQRMLNEPRSKQHRPRETHEFVVLNHILSASLAALTSTLREAAPAVPPFPPESRRALLSAQAALSKSLRRLAPASPAELPAAELPPAELLPAEEIPTPPAPPEAARQLHEQLVFLQKVSGDISRATEAAAG